MVLKKLYLVIAFLGALWVFPVRAFVFAYQEWENLKTGQVIEEYHEIHRGNNIINAEQQQELVVDAKKLGKEILIIAEDPSYRMNMDGLVIAPSMITGLGNICDSLAIPFFNCDQWQQTNSDISRNCDNSDILNYDDGSILNDYYRSLDRIAYMQSAELLKTPEQFQQVAKDSSPSLFIFESLLIAARCLHKVHSSEYKRFKIIAGSAHLVDFNVMLYKKGWVPKNLKIKDARSTIGNAAFEKAVAILRDYTRPLEKGFMKDVIEYSRYFAEFKPLPLKIIHAERDYLLKAKTAENMAAHKLAGNNSKEPALRSKL